MARQAETATSGAPFAKFNNVGDTLIAAFAGGKSRQQQDFKTKEMKKKDDGSPRLEEVMHFVAMPGTTATTGDVATPEAIAPGAHIRFAISGYKWKVVIDARKQLPEYAGFKAGSACSGDVYTVTLIGWSAETTNQTAARAAGFNVVEGRIVLRTQEEKDKYVLAQSRNNGNTNPAKDYEITVRRPTSAEKAWEQAADALFDSKPWERTPAAVGASADDGAPDSTGDFEPF